MQTEFRDLLWNFLEMCEKKGGEKAYNIIKVFVELHMYTEAVDSGVEKIGWKLCLSFTIFFLRGRCMACDVLEM